MRVRRNSDQRIRDLERQANESGQEEDLLAWLRERARHGDEEAIRELRFREQLPEARRQVEFTQGERTLRPLLFPNVTRWRELFEAEAPRSTTYRLPFPPELLDRVLVDYMGSPRSQIGRWYLIKDYAADQIPFLSRGDFEEGSGFGHGGVRAKASTTNERAHISVEVFHEPPVDWPILLDTYNRGIQIGPGMSISGLSERHGSERRGYTNYKQQYVKLRPELAEALAPRISSGAASPVEFKVTIREPETILISAQTGALFGETWLAIIPEAELRIAETRPVLENPSRGGDRRLRELQRAAQESGEVEDQVRYARALQAAGEPVEPWRTTPISYVFLEANRSWRWVGTRADPLAPKARVEAERLGIVADEELLIDPNASVEVTPPPAIPVGYELAPVPDLRRGPPRDTPVLLYEPWAYWKDWTPGYDWRLNWEIGQRPRFYMRADNPTLEFVAGRLPLERFYVVPSSYPMYRGPDEAHYVMNAGRHEEERVHTEAVAWFVSMGAIPYLLPEPTEITAMRSGEPTGGLRTPEQMEVYLRWWDAYRQRVLVQYENKKGAAWFPGGWASDRYFDMPLHGASRNDHNSRILFPHLFEKARLMRQVGKRWKNPR